VGEGVLTLRRGGTHQGGNHPWGAPSPALPHFFRDRQAHKQTNRQADRQTGVLNPHTG
jgi:hypothetical protein